MAGQSSRAEHGLDLDVLAERAAQQMVGFRHELVEIDRARLQRLLAREGQQLRASDRRRASAAVSAISADLAGARVGAGPFGQHVEVADDHGQQVVEVVGDAAGELADAFHLL